MAPCRTSEKHGSGKIFKPRSGPRREAKKKIKLGYYEQQELGPGPFDVESDFAAKNCTKNPGHQTFIPIGKFKQEDIPYYNTDKELFEYIKVVSDLTVRLRVNHTSSGRPDGGYYKSHGMTSQTGSGFVWKVVPCDEENCQCQDCITKPPEKKKQWRLYVDTALHVVFDYKEGKMTSADFFYDIDECRKDGRMKTVSCAKLLSKHEGSDCCWLVFLFSDEELATRLMDLCKRRRDLGTKLKERYQSDDCARNFVWLVSHPHGKPKHITFGQIKEEHRLEGEKFWQYSYDADSCPGSSGGGVWGLRGRDKPDYGFRLFRLRHCRRADEPNLNIGNE